MIVIVTAMDKEYEIVKKHLENSHKENGGLRGLFKDKDVLLIKTGIGKVNAAFGLTHSLCSLGNVERVVSIGCACAAVADLSVCDIVVGNSYCYHDVYCGEPNEHGQVQDLPAVFPSAFSFLNEAERYTLGTIATGDRFIVMKEEIEEIKNFLPSVYNICAIDMESAAFAQVCYKTGVPFVSIRAISDNPLLPKNHEEQYEDFWRNIAEAAFKALFKLI